MSRAEGESIDVGREEKGGGKPFVVLDSEEARGSGGGGGGGRGETGLESNDCRGVEVDVRLLSTSTDSTEGTTEGAVESVSRGFARY